LHLLGLDELTQQFPSRGVVAGDLGEADGRAVVVVDRLDHGAGPKPRAVATHAPTLGLMAPRACRLGQRVRRHAGRAILLGEEAFERAAEDLLGGIALDAPGAGVPTAYPALPIEHEDGVV